MSGGTNCHEASGALNLKEVHYAYNAWYTS